MQDHYKIPVGGKIRLERHVNESTGYANSIILSESLKLTSSRYSPPKRGRVGAEGTNYWTIKGTKEGVFYIGLVNARSWEPAKQRDVKLIKVEVVGRGPGKMGQMAAARPAEAGVGQGRNRAAVVSKKLL